MDRFKRKPYINDEDILYYFIIAILLESKLVDNKEKARLEMHYDFIQEDIMKDIESYFATENESTNSTE